MKRLLGLTLLTVLLSWVGFAGPIWTSPALPATSSYLLGDPTSGPLADTQDWPWFIQLGGLGLSPGQQMTISVAGDLCYYGACTEGEMPAVLGLVFTTSNTALGFTNIDRLDVADGGNVPSGAVGAVSPTTYYSNPGLSTDIDGDFEMRDGDTLTVIIPAGATWLAVGVWDSYFRDNHDPTPNVTVTVGTPDSLVPEPSTYLMAFAGLAGLWTLRRKRA